jgi:hypothetical protein
MITGGGRREEAGQAKPPDQRPGQPAGAVVSATGRAAHYEIRVGGVLDSRWAAWFDGLQVIGEGEETVISGLLADQPALLAKIRDLGLCLISVRRLDTGKWRKWDTVVNPRGGEFSPDRGNHAIRITRAGRTHPAVLRSVRYLVGHLACTWLGGRCDGIWARTPDYSALCAPGSWPVRTGPSYLS